MVIQQDKAIPMPRPFGGRAPTITVTPKGDAPEQGHKISVQISGPICNVYQFLEFRQVLQCATEADEIDVYIDTPGGCVMTTTLLVEWMNTSKAHVTAVANGLVASAGTFLWFFTKNRRVENWATFMFHSSSHGDFGKSLSIHENAKEMVKYMEKIVKALIAKGILTSEEASQIFAQKKDLFVAGKVIRARMLDAMASTEGLRLVAEDDPNPGTGSENDHPEDPEGEPDENADKDLDKKVTEVGSPVDFSKILAEEGVDPADIPDTGDADGDGDGDADGDADGDGDGDGDADGDGDGDAGDGATAKCGKKKGKKSSKRRPRGDGDGDGDGDGQGDGDGATPENPIDPEKAPEMTSYLKW